MIIIMMNNKVMIEITNQQRLHQGVDISILALHLPPLLHHPNQYQWSFSYYPHTNMSNGKDTSSPSSPSASSSSSSAAATADVGGDEEATGTEIAGRATPPPNAIFVVDAPVTGVVDLIVVVVRVVGATDDDDGDVVDEGNPSNSSSVRPIRLVGNEWNE
jgi:hypothetical protein